MSPQGIDAYRVTSVLGYCLLPMVGVGALSVMVTLEYVSVSLPAQSKSNIYYQRLDGIFTFFAIHFLVYVFSIRHLRRRAAYVRPTTSRCIPCWAFIRLLCTSQHLPCRLRHLVARLKNHDVTSLG